MERKHFKRATVLCFVFLIAVVSFFIHDFDPTGAKVHHILVQDMTPAFSPTWDVGMNKLWQLGPGVIPHLAAETATRDTAFSRKYATLWTNSPAWLKKHLSRPVNSADVREAATHAISEF